MSDSSINREADFIVTSEQVTRLERALLSLRQSSIGSPQALQTIAAIQYQEIIRLRAELDAAMGFSEENCDLTISLGGPTIGFGIAPASAIVGFLNNFHAALQSIAVFVASGELPGNGRLPQSISRSSDFRFVGAASGSVRLKLNLPEPQTLFPQLDMEPVERSLQLMLETIEWVDSVKQVDELGDRVRDDRLLRLLLTQVQRVAPSPNGAIHRVEFFGRLVKSDMRHVLSRRSANRIRDAVDTIAAKSAAVVEEGKLRSVDMDSGVFQLRQRPNDQPDIRCRLPRGIMTQAISYLLEDSVVAVSGVMEFDNKGRPTLLIAEDIYEVRSDT